MRRIGLLLVVLGACGRVGFDVPETNAIDASDADRSDSSSVVCEDLPGILFCDSFEGGTKLGTLEAVPPSFVRADGERAFRGQTSLHARTTRTPEPAWYLGTVLPGLTSGEVHARFYLYYPSSNPSRSFASVHLISAEAPNTGVIVGATNGDLDITASENNDFDISTVPLPLDRWACLQLRFTIGPSSTVETWIDGAMAARLVGVDTLPIGGISNVHAGLFNAAGNGTNDMWTDELAVGTQPIACL